MCKLLQLCDACAAMSQGCGIISPSVSLPTALFLHEGLLRWRCHPTVRLAFFVTPVRSSASGFRLCLPSGTAASLRWRNRALSAGAKDCGLQCMKPEGYWAGAFRCICRIFLRGRWRLLLQRQRASLPLPGIDHTGIEGFATLLLFTMVSSGLNPKP